MNDEFNTRVLVIDDEQVVRDSFREILSSPRISASALALEESAAALFGEPLRPFRRSTGTFDFIVDEAATGERGLEQIRSAIAAGKPYALIFLDMRMPGWDGLITAKRIRAVDEKVEIVFVTAYSDHSIEEIVAEAGANVGYHCKPFSPDEIRQIATKAVYEWNKLRSLEGLIQITGELRAGEKQIDTLLRCVLDQICERVGSRSAAIVTRVRAGQKDYIARLTTGELNDAQRLQPILRDLSSRPPPQEILRRGRVLLIPVDEFTIITLIEGERGLQTERLYLLRLFVEHASRAVESSRLHAELTQRERLSALGSAMSQVVHDMRQPITIIRAAVSLANRAAAQPERLLELHKMIASGAEDMMSYIEDLIAFTRNEPAALERGDLSELFASIEKKARCALEGRASLLEFDVEPGIFARIAPRKIQRVVLNLITNAVEALRPDAGDAPHVRVSLKQRGDKVILRVSDDGPGVPEEIRPTIFEPFITHGKAGGSGLGLAIGRQIAEIHGGTLELIESERGAVFELTLPAA